MSGFVCPNCKNETQIFAPTTGGALQMSKEMNVPFLGSVPIDPQLAKCCDQGLNYFEEYPKSPAVISLSNIISSKFYYILFLFQCLIVYYFRNKGNDWK